MPQEIEVPGYGIVEFPDHMSDDDIKAAIKRNILKLGPQSQPGSTPAPTAAAQQAVPAPTRTWTEAAGDFGAGVVGGVGSLVSLPGQLYGLATGDFNNASTQAGDWVQKYGQSLQTDNLNQRQAAREQRTKPAEGTGFLNEKLAVLRDYWNDPGLAAYDVAGAVPSLVGSFGAGKLTQMGVQGLARNAAAKTIQNAGVAGGAGFNSALQGGSVGEETYKKALQIPDEVLLQDPEYQAARRRGLGHEDARKEVALSSARMAAAPAAAASLVTSIILPGAEKAMFKKDFAKTIPGAIGKGTLGEGVQEYAEEGLGKLSENYALQQIDPNQDLMKGVGIAATRGGVTGGLLGGVTGGAGRMVRGPQPAAPATPDPNQQPDPNQPPVQPVQQPAPTPEQEQAEENKIAYANAKAQAEEFLEKFPQLAAGLEQYAEAAKQGNLDARYVQDVMRGMNIVPEIMPDARIQPQFVFAQADKDNQGKDVAGSYIERLQQVRATALDPTNKFFDPIATLGHESVHHIQALLESGAVQSGKLLEIKNARDQVFSVVANKWSNGSTLWDALPRSARRQLGTEGQKYLRERLEGVPKDERNPFEVEAYLIGATFADRIAKTEPEKQNFIGRALSTMADFAERLGNRMMGRGNANLADLVNDVMNGNLGRALIAQGIYANPANVGQLKQAQQAQPAPAQQAQPAPAPAPTPSTPAAQGAVVPAPPPPSTPAAPSAVAPAPTPISQPAQSAVAPAPPPPSSSKLQALLDSVPSDSPAQATPSQLVTPPPVDVSKIRQAQKNVVKRILGEGLGVEEAANKTKLSLEQVRAVRDELNRNLKPDEVRYSRAQPQQEITSRGNNIVGTKTEQTERYSRAPAQSLENANEFAKWFGQSKAVNPDGTPRRYYHGTGKDFDRFGGAKSAAMNGKTGPFFLSPDPEFSSDFATYDGSKGGQRKPIANGRVIPAFVSAQDPFDYRNPEHMTALADRLATERNYTGERAKVFKYALTSDKAFKRGSWPMFERKDIQRTIRDLGHDGFYVNENGTRNLAVFDPKQIKGVFNEFNPGTADDARYSRATPQQQKIIDQKIAPPSSRWQRYMSALPMKGRGRETFVQNFFDYTYSIAVAERAKNNGVLPDADKSASKMFRIANNAPSIASAAITVAPPEFTNQPGDMNGIKPRKDIKSITNILAEIAEKYGNIGVQHFSAFLAGKRAQVLIKDGREKLMSASDAAELVALGKQYPGFTDWQKDWVKFNEAILDFAVDSGFLTAKQRAAWNKYSDYVPFYRMIDDDVKQPPASKGLGSDGQASYRLRGRDIQLANIIENMVLNTEALVKKSVKARAKRVFEENFHPSTGSNLLTKLPRANAVSAVATDDSVQRAIAKTLGVAMNDPIIQSLPQNNDIYEVMALEKQDGNDILVVRGPDPYGNNEDVRVYRVNDPLVAQSLSFVKMSETGAMAWASLPKRLFTRTITMTPGFMVRNLFRDSVSARVLTNTNFIPLIDSLKGMSAALKNDERVDALRIGGGSPTGMFYSQSHIRKFNQLKKGMGNPLLVTARNAFGMLEALGEATEHANRIAIREKALQTPGVSTAEANYRALDIMDFSLSGQHKAIQFLIATVPFLNARWQGMYRLARGATNPETRTHFWALGMGLLGATALLAAANSGDDRYERITDVGKDNYIHIFLDKFLPKEALEAAGLSNYHITLPKPFEIGQLFMTMPERALRKYWGNDKPKAFYESALRIAADTFKLNPIEFGPYPVKPALEQAMNRDVFRERPIVGPYLEDPKNRYMEYYPQTPEVLKAAAKGADKVGVPLSPLRMQKAIRDVFGTWGDWSIVAADMGWRKINGMPARVEVRSSDKLWMNATGLNAFIQHNDPIVTKYEQDFNKLAKEVDGVVRSTSRLKTNPDERVEYAKENEFELKIAPGIRKVREKLTKMRREEEILHRSGDPDAAQKILNIQRQRAAELREFMKDVEREEAKYGR